MKKTLFLLLVTLLHGLAFGQTSKKEVLKIPKVCTITIPCSKADSAQALIEKGKICEAQLENENRKANYYQQTVMIQDEKIETLQVGNEEKQKLIDEQSGTIILQDNKILKQDNYIVLLNQKVSNSRKVIFGLGLAVVVQIARLL